MAAVVKKYPHILVYSIENNLAPTIDFYQYDMGETVQVCVCVSWVCLVRDGVFFFVVFVFCLCFVCSCLRVHPLCGRFPARRFHRVRFSRHWKQFSPDHFESKYAYLYQ